jgi:hypothetical protein
MNAYKLSTEFEFENSEWNEDNLRHWGKQSAVMLIEQQSKIDALTEALKIMGINAELILKDA